MTEISSPVEILSSSEGRAIAQAVSRHTSQTTEGKLMYVDGKQKAVPLHTMEAKGGGEV
jgi:hypothetical protein